jgi:hypothetical protein
LPVRLGREPRVVPEAVGGVGDVVLGLAQRLAAVERLERREVAGVVVDRVGDLCSSARDRARGFGPRPLVEGLRAIAIARAASAAVASATRS